MLEEFQSHLDGEEKRRDDAEDKLHKASKNLVAVKAGVEHLADKLYHLKAVSSFHVFYLHFFCRVSFFIDVFMSSQH